jgi:branched-chain amino acid transport system substrate-binding protein
MNQKNSLVVAAVATGLLAGIGITAPQVKADVSCPIHVGFSIAKSGYMAPYDVPASNGAILAIEELNENGGLLGCQIEHTTLDMRTDAALSARTGAELVEMGVDLLITDSDYDLGAPAALAALDKGVVAFATGAADPKMGVQGVGWQTFTANGAAQVEGIVMAEWAYEQGFRTAFVLEDELLEYNKSGCAGFRAAWRDLAGEDSIVGEDTFLNSDPSIAVQISRVRSADPQPDAIFMCSLPPGGASALRQIRAAGLDMPILGTVGMTGDHWIGATPDLSDFYYPTPMSEFGDDPRPEVQEFAEAYEARFGERIPMAYAVFGYLVIEKWSRAVERAGTTDAKAVVAELEKFDREPTIIGPSSFSSELHIQVDRPLLVMEVQNGKQQALELWEPSFTPDMPLLFRVGE